jgi:hypothetical protein
MRRWRRSTWVLIAWTAYILWAVAILLTAAAGATDPEAARTALLTLWRPLVSWLVGAGVIYLFRRPPGLVARHMPRWRRSTWAFVLWTGVMWLWIIVIVTYASSPGREPYEIEAMAFGTMFAFAFWLVGLMVIGLIRIVKRPPPSAPSVDTARQPATADTWQVRPMASDEAGGEAGPRSADVRAQES